jgi:hypothetical protein
MKAYDYLVGLLDSIPYNVVFIGKRFKIACIRGRGIMSTITK